MSPNAKRYGLGSKENIDLDIRLCRIEAELERCLKSYDEGDTSDSNVVTIRVTLIPQVTGFRVTGKTVSTVSFAWDQMQISDLRRYELWIAENRGFTENLQRFNIPSTEFTFSTLTLTGGAGSTTIYAKVRARGIAGNVGSFSTIISTTAGRVQTDEIVDQAVTVEKILVEYEVDKRVWTEENDGAGSGLDADTLDGYHASELFVPLENTINDVVPNYESYDTGAETMTNVAWSVTHYLNAYPRHAEFWLECITADGYVAGDRIPLTWEAASMEDGLNQNCITPWINATAVGYARSDIQKPWKIAKNGGLADALVVDRWVFVARLWK